MSKLKVTFAVLASLLVVIAIPIAVLLLAPMTYSGLLERGVRSATGLTANMSGLEVDLFPPRVAVDDLRLSNPRLANSAALLTLETFSATMSPGDWWKEAPTWWSATAAGVVVRAAQDADGRSNWDTTDDDQQTQDQPDDASTAEDTQNDGTGPMFSFDTIKATDLHFIRVTDDDTHQLNVAEMVLRKEQDERLNITLDANYRDEPLSAEGTLALPRSDRARDVDFEASIFGNEIRMRGRVGHDGLVPGEVHISAQLKDLSTVSQLLDQDLSRFTPITLDGMLNAPQPGRWEITGQGELGTSTFDIESAANVNEDMVELDKLALEFGDSSLTANGQLNSAARSAELKLEAERLNIDQLLSYATTTEKDEENPPRSDDFDPGWLAAWTITVDATAARLDYQPYRLQGLTVSVDDRNGMLRTKGSLQGLTASVENAIEDNGYEEEDTEEQPSGKVEDTQDGATKSSTDMAAWRLVSPVEFKADLTLARDTGDWPLTAQVSTDGANAELDTALPVRSDTDFNGKINATIEKLAFVEGVKTDSWESFLPFTLAVAAESKQSKLTLNPITVGISGNAMDGEISIDRAHEPLQITGSLNSKLLDLNQFATTAAENVEGKGEQIDKDSGDVIGNEPIDWSWLNAATVDLKLTLDKFNFNQASMSNVRTDVKLQNGELTVDPLKANLKKGGIRGDLRVKQKSEGASLDGSLIATGLTPADLGRKNAGLIDGGETDVLINLHTDGANPQALAAGLDGEIALEIQRATIRNSLFEIIGSDILTETFNLINPFAKEDDRTELECAAVYFKAEDGVLTSPDQLVIETNKMKIRGGGEVDLGEETLMIDFVPTPRQGLGISLSSLSSVVRLGGTLGNPQPVADPSGILKAGATIGAAVATGGLSLLGQGLFDRVRSAGTACGKIFEQVPATDIPTAIDPPAAVDKK